jgi:hypothetical protein
MALPLRAGNVVEAVLLAANGDEAGCIPRTRQPPPSVTKASRMKYLKVYGPLLLVGIVAVALVFRVEAIRKIVVGS